MVITADAGPLVNRELGDALGPGKMAGEMLAEARTAPTSRPYRIVHPFSHGPALQLRKTQSKQVD